MAEYMTLLGAEQVQSAARQMQSAADDMKQAASWIDESMRQQRNFLDDWLARFEAALAAADRGNVPNGYDR